MAIESPCPACKSPRARVYRVMPGLVAVAGNLEWRMLTILPGLVASGGALLFGVNTWCLDGRERCGATACRSRPGSCSSRAGCVLFEVLLAPRLSRCVLAALRAGNHLRGGRGAGLLDARRLRAGGRAGDALEHRATVRGGPAQCPGHARSTRRDGRLQRPAGHGHDGDGARLLRARELDESGTPWPSR